MGTQENKEIVLRDVVKEFRYGGRTLRVLQGLNLEVPKGVMATVVGPSGSGKTTLLNILGALDRPTSGQAFIDGTDLNAMAERQLTVYRRQKIGFVFQFFNLIPNLTALENVMLPMEYARIPEKQAKARARELLELVGMGHRTSHFPGPLSGGEQQRVAIARALANDAPIILADEPTGNLDSRTGEEIVGLLHRLVQEQGKTVVVVTHDVAIENIADVSFEIRDGRIEASQIKTRRT